tara:strand:- start:224 stop:868 length:645 start_codon:yes stop_codon:yes gene_type:complete
MTGKIKLVHSGGNAVSLSVPTNNPSASEVELKLPQSDGSANEFLKTDGSGNLSFAEAGGGKLLQVQQTVKTDTASTTVASGVPSSTIFLPVNITPASASNKILIMVSASVSDHGNVAIILQKNGSNLDAATGDAAGSRERTTASTYMAADTHLSTIHTAYLDTAGSTSQITYGFKLFCQDNNTTTIYLNRMVSSYDYVYGYRNSSMIQVMEIAA